MSPSGPWWLAAAKRWPAPSTSTADAAAFDRASTLAWTQAQVQLRHLGIRPTEADLFQRLAGHLVFARPALRPGSGTIQHGSGPQSGLWAQGISGDLPILLLRIGDSADLGVARQVLLAHEYFRLKQLAVDLVILNEHAASYSQDLQIALEALVRMQPRTPEVPGAAAKGAVFLLRGDLIPAETAALLASAARVVLSAERGSLLDQLRVREAGVPPVPAARATGDPGTAIPPVPKLEFFNGYGGFAEEGREYVVVPRPGQSTPRTLDQRDCERWLRLPGRGRGRWLHVEPEQPRKPDHAMV